MTPPGRLPIDLAVHDDLIDHARERAPQECCGLMASKYGKLVKSYRATNVAMRRERGFEIAAAEQRAIRMDIDRNALTLAAVYHSHPRAAAWPSPRDVALAYPGVLQLIVGLGGDVRAFWVAGISVTPVELKLCE